MNTSGVSWFGLGTKLNEYMNSLLPQLNYFQFFFIGEG